MAINRDFVGVAAAAGAAATVTTTAAIVLSGRREDTTPWAPLNAVSHIAFGEKAASVESLSSKYTGTGFALNAAAMGAWAGVYAGLAGRGRDRTVARSLIAGVATAGIAYVVDYYVVPKRLTPGFEKRLSNRSLLAIYAALAAGLTLGGSSKTRD